MPIPTPDTKHVEEALKLLTSMFKDRHNIEGFVKSFIQPVQEIEDQTWIYLSGIILATCVGDVLDKYGAIVGVARNGRLDTPYRLAIKIQIALNKSNGLGEDVISILALLLGTDFTYTESPPASFFVETKIVTNNDLTRTLLYLVQHARAAAIRAITIYQTAAATKVIFSDGPGTGNGSFSDAQSDINVPLEGFFVSGQET